jgi:excisionase family DNA binding protein
MTLRKEVIADLQDDELLDRTEGGPMSKQGYLSPREVAKLAGVSEDKILRAVREGEISHVRLGWRTIRLKPEWVQAWLDAHTQSAKV